MNHDDDVERPLPGLERFGAQLVSAAERQPAARQRRFRLGRPAFIAIAASLLVAGAAGAGVLISVGDPVESRDDAPPRSRPASAPQFAVTARDPDGRLPWAARIYTSRKGAPCIVAGRAKGKQLGQLIGDEFRPLPADAYGACGFLTPRRLFFTAGAAPGETNRSLVYGRAGSAVKSLTVETPKGRQEVPLGPGGAFLLVFEGKLDPRDVSLRRGF